METAYKIWADLPVIQGFPSEVSAQSEQNSRLEYGLVLLMNAAGNAAHALIHFMPFEFSDTYANVQSENPGPSL